MLYSSTKLNIFIITLVSLFTIHYSLFISVAYAHCPLCTAGAGAGLFLSRWLGIDDSITGVWMAAFLAASSLWAANSIKRKFLPYQDTLIYLAVFVSTVWSFYVFNLVSEHAGMIMGIPKLTFGIISGGLVFFLVDKLNLLIKVKYGKSLFPYQSIVFSLSSMIFLSLGIFIFINYYI
jgi:hypothetical protein